MKKVTEYYVDNLSCANCAKKFELALNAIPTVEHAEVNFMAAKIRIEGEATIEEIEQAGAYDHIQVRQAPKSDSESKTFQIETEQLKVALAGVLILLALYLDSQAWNTGALLTYIIAILIGGFDLFIEGLKNLSHLNFDMSTLMTISIIGAALIGEWQEAAVVVILFAISEALESYSMDSARQSIGKIMTLAPQSAIVLDQGQEVIKKVQEIQIGEVILVKPGQRIAMDGHIIQGITSVNQAAITGESVPVVKSVGDQVFAGTLNEEGLIQVSVEKVQADNTLSKIIRLVEDAQSKQAPAQAFIDKFAKYYTPLIMLLALLIMVIPPLFLGGNWQEWIYQGLAILIIGCPCALVISTPVAIVTAIGNAARQGILIKGGIHLEELGKVQVAAFDKTGTLTQGQAQVVEVVKLIDNPQADAILYHLEKNTTHPLAKAVTDYLSQQQTEPLALLLEDIQSITGQGVRASYKGEAYYAGSISLFKDQLGLDLSSIQSQLNTLMDQGLTLVLFGNKKELYQILAISDTIRPHMPQVIQELNDLGLETLMLTGDNLQVARAIGKQLGVRRLEANQMPQDKLRVIESFNNDRKVLMVGDGVNDAPALAAATVGVAMGQAGTDTALETADLVLMSDDMTGLPYAIRLSRKALTIIKQNISFALGLKLLALILVIPGWLTLWMAVFSDIGATVLVILNSLRLLKNKI